MLMRVTSKCTFLTSGTKIVTKETVNVLFRR